MQRGIFHVCDPYCGECKPPTPRPRICPVCGHNNDFEHYGPVSCAACGAPLSGWERPEPCYCQSFDVMCANPCGKPRQKAPDAFKGFICRHHTPVA